MARARGRDGREDAEVAYADSRKKVWIAERSAPGRTVFPKISVNEARIAGQSLEVSGKAARN
jgi:hypothetical protein